MSSEPNRVVIKFDRDPAVSPDIAALTGMVCALFQNVVPAHERSDAAVTAAAHRIFRDPVAWRKRTHFEVGGHAGGVEAKDVDSRDADRVQRRELAHVGSEGKHGVTAGELESEPYRPDVDDRGALHIGR